MSRRVRQEGRAAAKPTRAHTPNPHPYSHENELVGGFTAYAARFAMPAPASGTANVW